jgi:hypothetical protein
MFQSITRSRRDEYSLRTSGKLRCGKSGKKDPGLKRTRNFLVSFNEYIWTPRSIWTP